MKKFFLIICFMLFTFTINVKAYTLPEKTNHEKVTIHIFRGTGCSHCYDAMKYFTSHKDLYDYIDFKVYEVSNKNNKKLLEDFLQSTGMEYEGVPHIVIGSSYNAAGFANYIANDIVNVALSEYQNKDYKDVIGKMSKNYEVSAQSLQEAWKEENGSTTELLIAIGIIALVAISGFLLIKKSGK